MSSKQLTLHIDIDLNDNETGAFSYEDERFANAIKYGLLSAVTIEELAKMCCQSISTFKRHFHARYSIPPHHWFIICKLELAYKIINERDIAIIELAKLCGFNTTSHFIATFRKRYGISPARLRKQLRQQEQQVSKTQEDNTKE